MTVLGHLLRTLWPHHPPAGEAAGWSPLVDIEESAAEYTVKAEVPEVRPSELVVLLESHQLTIRGERHTSLREDSVRFHHVERSYGEFARTFELPKDVDEKAVAAEFEDGLLRVHLPKRHVERRPTGRVARRTRR